MPDGKYLNDEICINWQVNAIIFEVKLGFVRAKWVSYVSSTEVKLRY
jgi:hypothetical protein